MSGEPSDGLRPSTFDLNDPWRSAALRLGPCPWGMGDRVEIDPVCRCDKKRRVGRITERCRHEKQFTTVIHGKEAVWDVGFIGYDSWLVKIKDEATGEIHGWINVHWLLWPSTVDMVA